MNQKDACGSLHDLSLYWLFKGNLYRKWYGLLQCHVVSTLGIIKMISLSPYRTNSWRETEQKAQECASRDKKRGKVVWNV